MSQTETIAIIKEAVALADSDQASWVDATEVDKWLTSWGTDEDSPEDIAEIQKAYAEYESGNYITFKQYLTKRGITL
jgi:hypothetical protein